MFVVPGQSIGIRASGQISSGAIDLLTVKRVVVLAVLKLLLYAAAHLELQIGRYRHVARIEQAVDVAPQE